MSDQDVCMIFKRNLPTGCQSCGMSEIYCQAVREMESRTCCGDGCSHS